MDLLRKGLYVGILTDNLKEGNLCIEHCRSLAFASSVASISDRQRATMRDRIIAFLLAFFPQPPLRLLFLLRVRRGIGRDIAAYAGISIIRFMHRLNPLFTNCRRNYNKCELQICLLNCQSLLYPAIKGNKPANFDTFCNLYTVMSEVITVSCI